MNEPSTKPSNALSKGASATQSQEVQAEVLPSRSDIPLPSGDPSELTFEEARDLGLLRDDAVDVSGPAEVSTGGRPARVKVLIALPATDVGPLPGDRVEVDWSGDCRLPAGAAHQTLTIPKDATQLTASISAGLPEGRDNCDLRADAFFTAKTYTGDGVTVRLRR